MSKVIDKRVVEMEFNNARFEKNIQATMTSLDKLKQSLRFDGATKGFEELDKAANSMSLDGIVSGVSALERRFSTFGIVGMRVIERMTDSVINLSHRMTSFVTDGIVQGGIKRAMNIENAHFQLQGLLKDEEAVQSIMNDAMDSVNETAYAYDSAAKAAAQFAASGMRSGEQMQGALRAITGVAAMTNSEYEDISRIFTTISGNGRVMGEQLLQLSSRGLNAAATLAEYLGTTESEVRSMVSDGKISFDIFASAMDNAFGAHAKKANETFTGAMSNIRAALAKIGADFVSPLLVQNGPLVDLLNTIRMRINDAKNAIQPLATSFVKVSTKAIESTTAFLEKLDVKSMVERFVSMVNLTGTSIRDFFEQFSPNSKWNEFTDKLKGAGISVEDFQTKLKETAKANGISIDDILKKAGSLSEAFRNGSLSTDLVIDTLGKLSEEQLKNIGYTDEQIVKIRALSDEAKKAGSPVNELIESLSKPSKGELLIDTVRNVFGSIKSVVKTISEAWSAIFSDNTSYDLLYTFLETIHDISTRLIVTEEGASKLQRTFKGLFAALDLVTTITRTGLKFTLELIQEVLKAFGVMDVDVLSITANVGDAIVAFRDWAKEHGVITKALQTVIPVVSELIVKVVEIIKKVYELPVVQKVVKKVIDVLSDLFANLGKYIGGGLDQISLFLDHMKEFDNFSLENVKKALKDFKETVIDYFIDVDAIKDIGTYIIEGLVNGLKQGTTIAVDAVIEIGKALLQGIMDFLGIHSPSLKFMEIGEYIISGLVIGIKNGLSTIFGIVFEAGGTVVDGFVQGIRITMTAIADIIKEIYNAVSTTVSQIDFDKIFVGGFLVGVLVTINKLINAFDKLVSPLDSLSGVFDSLSGVLDGLNRSETKSEAMINMAKALGLLVISIYAISQFKNEDLIKGVGVVSGLMIGMTVLMKVMSKMDSNTDFGKVSKLLYGLSGSLLILSGVIKILSGIDFWEGMAAIGQITLLIGGFIALIAAYGKLVKGKAAENADEMGKMIRKMSVSIGLLVVVIKLLSSMSSGDIAKGLVTIGLLEALFAGFVYVSQYAGKNGSKAGGMLLKMSGAMLILVGVVSAVSHMSPETINKGLMFVAKAEILFAAMVAVSKYAGENGSKAGGMLLKMSGAMLILVGVVATVGFLSEDTIDKGLAFVAKAEILFGAVVMVSKFAGEHGSKAGSMLIKMSSAMLILVGTVAVISVMDPDDINKGMIFVAKAELLFGALITVSKFAGEHADKAGNMLLKMTIPITVLAIAVAALSFLDSDKVMKASQSLSLVIGAFSILVASTSKIQKASGSLIMLTAAVAAIGGVLFLLQGLPVDSTLANATALSGVLIALSGAVTILSKSDSVNARALAATAVLTAIMSAVGGILYAVKDLPVETTLINATALSEVLLALSLAVNILGDAGTVSMNAMGAVALLTGAVAGIAGILYLVQDLPVETTLVNATALSEVLLALSAVTVILGQFGSGSMAGAVEGAAALDAVLVIVSGLFVTIGGLVTLIPSLEEFLDKGIDVLNKVGQGIGSFLGNIAGGVMEGISSNLPGVADNLSAFMQHLDPFIQGASKIDEASMNGVSSLASIVLKLTEASFLDSITKFIAGEESLVKFSQQLQPFGQAMVDFSDQIKGRIDQEAVNAAANAGSMIADLSSKLQNTGGVLQFFTGEQDLSKFSERFTAFGDGIVAFSEKVKGEVDEGSVEAATNAGNMIVELSNNLQNTGGVIQFFTGEQDLGKFGSQLIDFGNAITNFSENVKGKIDKEAVQTATNAGIIVSKLYNYLGEENSIIDKFFGTGKKSVETFANELGQFGTGINSYYTAIKDIDSDKIINVTTSIDPLMKMIEQMEKLKDDGAKTFTFAINTLATANVKGFLETYGASSAKLLKVGNTMSETIAIGIKGKKDALNTAASESVSSILQTVNSAKNRFEAAGKNLMVSLHNGMVAVNNDITTTMGTILNSVVTTIRNYYNSFYTAGVYAGSGFANGLSDNQTPAINSAIAVASAALQALKKRLNEHSPSKETYKIGDYAGLGFVNALLDTMPLARRAGIDIADSAMSGLKKAMSTTQSIVDTDMNLQPTIRPVLDLSNVTSGAGTINDLFGVSPSIGVLANVGSINRMMNRNQGNKNSDVVSAIDKLRNDLGNINNQTYNINGVTYGEGSEVAEAIKTLVRAAIVDRRS